jgi:hypothetical protein
MTIAQRQQIFIIDGKAIAEKAKIARKKWSSSYFVRVFVAVLFPMDWQSGRAMRKIKAERQSTLTKQHFSARMIMQLYGLCSITRLVS